MIVCRNGVRCAELWWDRDCLLMGVVSKERLVYNRDECLWPQTWWLCWKMSLSIFRLLVVCLWVMASRYAASTTWRLHRPPGQLGRRLLFMLLYVNVAAMTVINVLSFLAALTGFLSISHKYKDGRQSNTQVRWKWSGKSRQIKRKRERDKVETKETLF